MKSPCYGCTKRNATCHSTCEDYDKWVKSEKERKRQIELEKLLDGLCSGHKRKSIK